MKKNLCSALLARGGALLCAVLLSAPALAHSIGEPHIELDSFANGLSAFLALGVFSLLVGRSIDYWLQNRDLRSKEKAKPD